MLTTVLMLLLLATSGSESCKGKARAKAASAASAGQENKNAASTTINMGDTGLLANYHEESVLMSVGVVFFCALMVWFIVFCVRRYGWCQKPERGYQPRVTWSNMSFRNRGHRSDEERGATMREGTRGPKVNRMSGLDELGE